MITQDYLIYNLLLLVFFSSPTPLFISAKIKKLLKFKKPTKTNQYENFSN